jgi:hypothetical protein
MMLFARLLQRQPPDTDALWEEVRDFVQPEDGFLVIDDSTLDKPYAKNMDLVLQFQINISILRTQALLRLTAKQGTHLQMA